MSIPTGSSLIVPTIEVNSLIEKTINMHNYTGVIIPTPTEKSFVLAEANRLCLDNIDNFTYDVIKNVGIQELNSLNSRLKDFTSKISNIESPGLFNIIDELSTSVQEANLEEIWKRTLNTKPTLGVRIKAFFKPTAIATNLQKQYKDIYVSLTEGSKGLEVKLGKIEGKLSEQRVIQERNIAILNSSFDMYYRVVEDLRKQFTLVLYMEGAFKEKFEAFEKENKGSQEPLIVRSRGEYQEILNDIENKRLTLHSTMLKIFVTTSQNSTLIGGCRKVLKEIDHTLSNSFINIRSNLVGLSVALNTQQSLLSTQNTKDLDKNLSTLYMNVNSELAVNVERYSAASRLKEAEDTKALISNLTKLSTELLVAKEASRADYSKATEMLIEATSDFNTFLGNPNGS